MPDAPAPICRLIAKRSVPPNLGGMRSTWPQCIVSRPEHPMTRLVLALALFGAPLAAQRAAIPQQLTFTPYRASGIYDVGETVGWTVTPGSAPPTYAYKWIIRRDNAVVLKEGKLNLSTGKDTIEIVAEQPEMIYVAVEAYADLTPPTTASAGDVQHFAGGNTGRDTGLYSVAPAVAPNKAGMSTLRPAAFEPFWAGKPAAQVRIPINPVLAPVATDVPGVEMSVFQLDALGSRAHGYVAKPAGEGKFPAIVQLQYAGVYALNA